MKGWWKINGYIIRNYFLKCGLGIILSFISEIYDYFKKYIEGLTNDNGKILKDALSEVYEGYKKKIKMELEFINHTNYSSRGYITYNIYNHFSKCKQLSLCIK